MQRFKIQMREDGDALEYMVTLKLVVCAISNAMGVNVQVYITSNILMSIQIISIGIDVIKFDRVILICNFVLN